MTHTHVRTHSWIDIGKEKHLSTAGGRVKWCIHYGNQCRCPPMLKTCLSYYPAKPLLRISPKNTTKITAHLCSFLIIHNGCEMEQAGDQIMWCIYTMEMEFEILILS